MRLLPGTKKFGFRTIVLTQAQQRSRLFVCLFRMPSFSAPAPPNRFRYPGARLLRPEQDGRERLRPSGRSAAASGGPAGRPTSAARGTAIPAHGSCLPPAPPNRFRYPGARLLRPEQDGRERLRPSGRSAAASGGPAGRPTSAARGTAIPAHGSCLPPAPPNRFRYPGARLLRPEQDGRERLRPSGRSAAASGGPAGRPTPAGRGTAIPPRRSQTGCFPSTAASASRRTTPGSGTDVAYRCV